MPWTNPKTWTAAETVDDADMNVQIRDNLLILKTKIDDNGLLRTLFYGNTTIVGNVGAAETDMFPWSLPANTLDGVGQGFRILAMGSLANNVNLKTVRFYIGNIAINNMISSTAALANNVFTIEVMFWYQDAAAARCWAHTTYNAISGAAPTHQHFVTYIGSLNWTWGTAMKFTGLATTTNDIQMYGIQIGPIR